jgi:hypothetical protein
VALFAALAVRLGGGRMPAWAIAAAALALLGGVQLLAIGLLGEYVGRVLDEAKQRPLYLVRETVGMKPAAERPPALTV